MRGRPALLGFIVASAVAMGVSGPPGAGGETVDPVPLGESITVSARTGPGLNPVMTGVTEPFYVPSIALGTPAHGRLRNGVRLPAEGTDYVTWDPVRSVSPNREWRRWGTDTLIRTFLRVARSYRAANPGAPKLVVGDLSRPQGGEFGRRFGGLGHASHQNGLDIDVYYPRADLRLLAPRRVSQIDHALAEDLLRRFLAVRPQHIFVGPSTGLRGPRRIVQPLVHHDDHLHVRIRNPWPLAGGPNISSSDPSGPSGR